MMRIGLVGVAAATLVACGTDEPSSEEAPAVEFADPIEASIIAADGQSIGSVTATENINGTTLRVSIDRGLEEGLKGVHLHETGRCDAPDFASAGGHWNPTSKEHGRDNPEGAHVGDLANLGVGEDGTGQSIYLVSVLQNGTGPSMADADGTALVVHAGPDDYQTDPSGDSGGRVGCAVIVAPKG